MMGEAKRRKETDPSFGKEKKPVPKGRPGRTGYRARVFEVDFGPADRVVMRKFSIAGGKLYEHTVSGTRRVDDLSTIAKVFEHLGDVEKERKAAKSLENAAETANPSEAATGVAAPTQS